MVSLRGWHIVSAGLIWVSSGIITYLNLMGSIILGTLFLLIGVAVIAIGMFKIVKYERYENSTRPDRPLSQMTPISGQQYNPFANEVEPNNTTITVTEQTPDPNDPNIRFSKKFQNSL